MAKKQTIHLNRHKEVDESGEEVETTQVLKDEEVLATLNEEEQQTIKRGTDTLQGLKNSIQQAIRQTASLQEIHRLAEAGQNNIWRVIKEKYDIPDEFMYDFETGEVKPPPMEEPTDG